MEWESSKAVPDGGEKEMRVILERRSVFTCIALELLLSENHPARHGVESSCRLCLKVN